MSLAEPSLPAAYRQGAPPASTVPRVAVIVLNWNGERDTTACVESFLAQRDVDVDLLLVDNASADGSGERLRARFPDVSYLQTGENLGYAGGNNRGIDWAMTRATEWVLVVNNDTVADPDCVRLLLAAAASDARLAAAAPLITRAEEPTRVWFAGGRFDRLRAVGTHDHENALVSAVPVSFEDDPPVLHECTFLTGCCLLLRAEALRAVGGFREDFYAYGEDLELAVRLRRNGWRLGWVPAARLAHRTPPAQPTPRQILLRDRNRRRLVRAHYGAAWRLAFALWFWPTRLIHLARYLMRGDTERAAAIREGMRAR
ncbi:MAG: glycosyltransferase family 2 protein [Gemmatimonadaceae bacterium]|nr:glycosyltransferase family 2 protein [Gemmatimonadaceae bacterium]